MERNVSVQLKSEAKRYKTSIYDSHFFFNDHILLLYTLHYMFVSSFESIGFTVFRAWPFQNCIFRVIIGVTIWLNGAQVSWETFPVVGPGFMPLAHSSSRQ